MKKTLTARKLRAGIVGNTGKIIKYNVFAEWQVDDTCYKVIFVLAETYIFYSG